MIISVILKYKYMLNEGLIKAPFHIDKGNIFNDILFTWMFPLINFIRKNEVTQENIFDRPHRLDYKSDLKKVRNLEKNQ
jgi:hypothetical protein